MKDPPGAQGGRREKETFGVDGGRKKKKVTVRHLVAKRGRQSPEITRKDLGEKKA